jgi:predicted CXXCH cytochrome family protein
VLGAGIVMLCVSVGLSAIPPRDSDGASRRFSHRNHVSPYWYGTSTQPRDAEYARDCRGCHDYAAKPMRDPREACASCHFDQALDGATGAQGGRWRVRVGTGPQKASANSNAMQDAYRHEDHLSLACRECHAPTDGMEEMHLPDAGSTGLCMRCHDATAPAVLEKVVSDASGPGPIETDGLQTRLMARLNTSPALQAEGRGPFRHTDHLTDPEIASSAKCAECHADVLRSSAIELTSHVVDTVACSRCHIAAEMGLVRIGVAARPVPTAAASLTALTFEHSDHYRSTPSEAHSRNSTVEGAHEIAAKDCLACHEHASLVGSREFPVRADRKGYAGCITCHDVERFKTKAHGQWDGCVACHDFGNETMKSNRVAAQVQRALPGSVRFEMPSTPHPGLSDRSSQTCAECHKAAIPAAKSTSSSQRFDHSQHVARNPTPESCDACHHTRRESTAAAQAGPNVTFDVNACDACHPGARIDPRSLEGIAARNVPAFSHAQHMQHAKDPRKPDQLVRCSTCHAIDEPKPGQIVGTIEGAANCTMCHAHDAAHAAWTGKIQGAQVESCARCHEDRMPVIASTPTVGERAAYAPRVTLSGGQFHPVGRACSECHIDTPSASKPSTSVIAVSGALFTLHAGNNYPGDCRSCHWALKSNSLGDQSPSLATRKREGASLERFPGGSEAAEMRRRSLEGTR